MLKREDLIQKEYGLFIGGDFRPASDGASFDVICPADGGHLAKCAEATREDVQEAVEVAWGAYGGFFGTWSQTGAMARAKILNKIADIIEENQDHFCAIESYDVGKPIRETYISDIPDTIEHFRYFAGMCLNDKGTSNKTGFCDFFYNMILREPLGVVGQIIPWNFPFLMAAWKLAPALAAGNCVVIKPSKEAPLSLLELARLTKDVLPPGVLNIVTGSGAKCGQYMLEVDGFKKIAFTGSTDVGQKVAHACADKIIPAGLELGAKNASIIFPDYANFEQAIEGVIMGSCFNQGQVCGAASRVFIHEDIYEKFTETLARRFNLIKVGWPWDPTTQMGSVINKAHMQKILDYIEIGKKEGATVAAGGFQVTEDGMDKGCFIRPTLLTNVKHDMRVAREEIFGPVLVAIPFAREDECIAMVNSVDYGLTGAVFTGNIQKALRVASAIETGRVWINCFGLIPAGTAFGGVKKSGFSREVYAGALDSYCQLRNIMISPLEAPFGAYSGNGY